MGKPRIGDIEQAIIELIQGDPTIAAYIRPASVRSHESGIDFENLEITLDDYGVLVMYEGGQYTPRVHDGSGYAIEERFTLIAVAQNLRSLTAAKQGNAGEIGVYDILEDLKSAIVAGRKLAIASIKDVRLELIGTVLMENLYYRKGAAAIGLQIRAHCAAWEYAA
jgi:hypothetical protein